MNISDFKDCYGCGVCAAACRKRIIDIKLNKYGFYEPFITNENGCTDCGLCVQVCSFHDERLAKSPIVIKSYAGWANDASIRLRSSSGGISMAIARYLLEENHIACGVRYNIKKERAEHFLTDSEDEFMASLGSKYIQSFTKDAFTSFNRNQKYLVYGSPCQIDSLRRYIQKVKIENNFVLVDFFCHGVPSYNMWVKYLKYAKEWIGDINYVTWRNKIRGWHRSQGMLIGKVEGEDHFITWDFGYDKLLKSGGRFINTFGNEDMFYRLYHTEKCYGNQCYEKCKFKFDQSSADIRIGDMWGNAFRSNEEGVSCVAVYSQRGDEILKSSNVYLEEMPFDIIAEKQLKNPLRKDNYYYKMRSLYENPETTIMDLDACINAYHKAARIKRIIGHMIHIRRSGKRIIRIIKERIKR